MKTIPDTLCATCEHFFRMKTSVGETTTVTCLRFPMAFENLPRQASRNGYPLVEQCTQYKKIEESEQKLLQE